MKKLLAFLLVAAVATTSIGANNNDYTARAFTDEERKCVESNVAAYLAEEAKRNPAIAVAMQTEAEKRKLIAHIALGVIVVGGAVAVAYSCGMWPFNEEKTEGIDKDAAARAAGKKIVRDAREKGQRAAAERAKKRAQELEAQAALCAKKPAARAKKGGGKQGTRVMPTRACKK